MLRASLLSLVLVLGCRHDSDPAPVHPTEGELPPLPPSSGTAVGYLLDSSSTLQLRDDQIAKLRDIDNSLGARNADIDTQIRIIEKPAEDPPAAKGEPPKMHNNAPGAQIKTTDDAQKLHAARKANVDEALTKAFAVLDAEQQPKARRILEDRGVTPPGSTAKPTVRSPEDGTPLQ